MKTVKTCKIILNLVYQNGMILTIKKSRRGTRKIVTAIDNIFTNTFMERTFKSGIFKSDLSDHFPVIFLIPSVKLLNEDEIFDICTKDIYLLKLLLLLTPTGIWK